MEHTSYCSPIKDPSRHVLNLPKLHLTCFRRCSMSWVLFREQDCGHRKHISIGMTAICLKNASKQKVQSRNLRYWQQTKKASCNLGCGSLWQNWVFGVYVNFKSMLEHVNRLDRLHASKLIHNIVLTVWKSTLTC